MFEDSISLSAVMRPAKASRSTARALPAGTFVCAGRLDSTREPSSAISCFRMPVGGLRVGPFEGIAAYELRQESGLVGRGLVRGRISKRSTGTPLRGQEMGRLHTCEPAAHDPDPSHCLLHGDRIPGSGSSSLPSS